MVWTVVKKGRRCQGGRHGNVQIHLLLFLNAPSVFVLLKAACTPVCMIKT